VEQQRVLDEPAGGGVGATYRQAVQRLAAHQKTAKGAPAYSRFVNRPVGRHLAALAFALRRTPNQVTALSAVCSFSALLLLVLLRPSMPMAVAVTFLLVLGYALDSADGQLARLQGGGSPVGEWLDHVVDAWKDVFVHSAVLISFYRFEDPSGSELLLPLAYLCLASAFFFTIMLTDSLRRLHGTRSATAAPAPLWRSLAALPNDYGLLCLTFLLLPAHEVFLTVYGLMVLGSALYYAAGLVVWYREVSRLARPSPALAPTP
jgi:phosphatidylglycerophosphate synthase